MNKGFIPILVVVIVVFGIVIAATTGCFYDSKDSGTKDNGMIVIDNKPIKDNGKIVIDNSQGSELVKEFLKDPTLENFRILCESSKNIPGSATKQVLDSNREEMVIESQSMYYDLGMVDCQNFDNKNSYFLTLDENLFVTFNENDTDELRTAKIDYNNQVKNLINTSELEFIIFGIKGGGYISPAIFFQESPYGGGYTFSLRGLGGYLGEASLW